MPAAASADLLGLLAFYDEKLDEMEAKEATPGSAPGEQPSAVSAMRECVFDDTLAPYAMTQMNEILAGDGATRLSAKLLKRLLSTRPPAPIDAFDEKKNAPSPSTTSKTLASTPVPAPPPLPPTAAATIACRFYPNAYAGHGSNANAGNAACRACRRQRGRPRRGDAEHTRCDPPIPSEPAPISAPGAAAVASSSSSSGGGPSGSSSRDAPTTATKATDETSTDDTTTKTKEEGLARVAAAAKEESALLDALRPWVAAHSVDDLLHVLPTLRLDLVPLDELRRHVQEPSGSLHAASNPSFEALRGAIVDQLLPGVQQPDARLRRRRAARADLLHHDGAHDRSGRRSGRSVLRALGPRRVLEARGQADLAHHERGTQVEGGLPECGPTQDLLRVRRKAQARQDRGERARGVCAARAPLAAADRRRRVEGRRRRLLLVAHRRRREEKARRRI